MEYFTAAYEWAAMQPMFMQVFLGAVLVGVSYVALIITLGMISAILD